MTDVPAWRGGPARLLAGLGDRGDGEPCRGRELEGATLKHARTGSLEVGLELLEGRGRIAHADVCCDMDPPHTANSHAGVGTAEGSLAQLGILDGGDGLLPRLEVDQIIASGCAHDLGANHARGHERARAWSTRW
nr:hypothetical protein [Enhygromyxa salina]